MKHMVGSYVSIAVPILHLIAVWRWGDWRRWQKYYPTMLFVIVVDFFGTIVTYPYSLWQFHASMFIPNHTINDFQIAIVILPSLVLIYLSMYPFVSPLLAQVGYTALFVVIHSLIEFFFFFAGLITYHHGWNFVWSVLLWVIMFPIIRIHYDRPWLAWLVCAGVAAFAIVYFDIPLAGAK